ncbi:hypothetical protein AB6A40_002552 [Gnathostoma spinigerum]|uniref:Uncharacterized protein n=1 Tax=Gnathostoma spinigerum TaxID=75299 RepID=A0ABD6E717_9BILA
MYGVDDYKSVSERRKYELISVIGAQTQTIFHFSIGTYISPFLHLLSSIQAVSAYMSEFELSSIGAWGVGGGAAAANQSMSSAAPPATCGTPLGVSTPIAACDPQQS